MQKREPERCRPDQRRQAADRAKAEIDDLRTDPAVAETLAIRYPEDLEGQLLVAKARRSHGAFLSAIAPLNRVISATRVPRSSECAMSRSLG